MQQQQQKNANDIFYEKNIFIKYIICILYIYTHYMCVYIYKICVYIL